MTIAATAEQIAMEFGVEFAMPHHDRLRLERAILRHMEHHMAEAAKAEREWCARVVELHECWVRDHSQQVFAERIAQQLRERRPGCCTCQTQAAESHSLPEWEG